MTTWNCWSIDRDGAFLPAKLLSESGRLVLDRQGDVKTDLGPWSPLAADALSKIPHEENFFGNYFQQYKSLSRTNAAEIIELLDECEWTCDTCMAQSAPGRGNIVPVGTVNEYISQSLITNEEGTLFLSGGEPTIHPSFFEIIDQLARSNATNCHVISNGNRIANDKTFCKKVKERWPSAKFYLQYDSYRNDDLVVLRGRPLAELRRLAIERLEENDIDYTLICVVARDLNDKIVGSIIDNELGRKNCIGITFQPIKFMGRVPGRLEHKGITSLEVAELLKAQTHVVEELELVPHSLNPLNWFIQYLDSSLEPIPNIVASSKGLYKSTGLGSKRIAVIWHTDYDNFVAESVVRHPIIFRSDDCVPMFVKYTKQAIASAVG